MSGLWRGHTQHWHPDQNLIGIGCHRAGRDLMGGRSVSSPNRDARGRTQGVPEARGVLVVENLPRQDSGLPGDIDDGLGCVRPCKTIGFIWCCRIGIGIAVGGEHPGPLFVSGLFACKGVLSGSSDCDQEADPWIGAGVSRDRPRSNGKSSVGEADSNNHDRDRSQHSSVHVHPPCLRSYLSTPCPLLPNIRTWPSLGFRCVMIIKMQSSTVTAISTRGYERAAAPRPLLPVDLPSHQRDRLLIDPRSIPSLDRRKFGSPGW